MSIASSATRWPASASRSVPTPPRGALTWIGWVVGAAALGAVVLGVAHFSEERELAALDGARSAGLAAPGRGPPGGTYARKATCGGG